MRKGKNLFLALAAGILLLTACNNEDLVEKSFVNGYGTVTAPWLMLHQLVVLQ